MYSAWSHELDGSSKGRQPPVEGETGEAGEGRRLGETDRPRLRENGPMAPEGEHHGSPLELALGRIGDRWSLRIVEALLAGPMRFTELQGALRGIATNILSQRLRHLEAAGVVLATAYSRRPPRFSYQLTAAGADLAGALALLSRWGAEQGGGEAESPVHGACGSSLDARWFCPTCEQVVEGEEATATHFV